MCAHSDAEMASAEGDGGDLRDASDGNDASLGSDAGTRDAGDAGRSCVYSPFAAPVQLSGLNVSGGLWGAALSNDGLTLYFAEKSDVDERIMMATRASRSSDFGQATELANVQSSAFDGTPFITADNLTLLFYSERAGRLG